MLSSWVIPTQKKDPETVLTERQLPFTEELKVFRTVSKSGVTLRYFL